MHTRSQTLSTHVPEKSCRVLIARAKTGEKIMHVHVIGRGSKHGALARSVGRRHSVASGWL